MLKKWLIGIAFAASLVTPFAQAQLRYMPGKDYEVLQETLDEGKAPKAIEFFWYGCPHCYHFEENLSQWLKSDQAAGITFEKVPAVTSNWALGAQLYYTAHALNLPNIDSKIFEAVHKYRNYAIIGNQAKAIDFLVANGAEKEKAERTWNSLAIKQKVARAKQLFDQSGVSGVPSILVNGIYTVSSGDNYDNFLAKVAFLAKQKSK